MNDTKITIDGDIQGHQIKVEHEHDIGCGCSIIAVLFLILGYGLIGVLEKLAAK